MKSVYQLSSWVFLSTFWPLKYLLRQAYNFCLRIINNIGKRPKTLFRIRINPIGNFWRSGGGDKMDLKRILYRMRVEYVNQHWYSEGIFELDSIRLILI